MLEQFPPEIVSNIVSSFDRFDFMQCAQVNRSWRQHLPPYSAHLWEQIHIKGDHHLVFLADTTFFGQYIKSCTITMLNDDAMVFLALERLQGRHLQSLVLDRFKVKDNKRLADLLRNLKCESLVFTGVTGACLDFIGIITAASGGGSHMRHFACHYDGMYPVLMSTFVLPPPPPPPPPDADNLDLVSLALTPQNLAADWMDILQRCSTTLQHIHIAVSNPTTISCHDIMKTCPRLQSMFIGEFSVPNMLNWPPTSSDKPGLRYFGHWGLCRDMDVMKFVLQHQHTLEFLYLDTWVNVQLPPWHHLNSFQSTTLNTLVCNNIHGCTPDTLVSLIRQSPNLDSVVLHPADPITDQVWNALRSLDTLKCLSIHLALQHHDGSDRIQEWRTMTRRLGAMKTLRQLELNGLNGVSSNECCQLFQMLHDIPTLVKLRLSHIRGLDDKALETLIPHVQSMEKLNIANCPIVTARGIKTLIDGLPRLRHMIYSLSCTYNLPFGVYDLISYAKSSLGIKLVINRLD
ncbi:hypothetical protein LRAMOSA11302 [Lichtheimia ramosa]|uniref:F-box domain-containing protein n=1 Tax=Lichtheimia ramosa TaxID=688394 RepID=A0A077WT84_9FUNG|nr:hypothetical protein LRAMOSA11302 [Lichtheimia ramosa]